jgi:hypothetical protein
MNRAYDKDFVISLIFHGQHNILNGHIRQGQMNDRQDIVGGCPAIPDQDYQVS